MAKKTFRTRLYILGENKLEKTCAAVRDITAQDSTSPFDIMRMAVGMWLDGEMPGARLISSGISTLYENGDFTSSYLKRENASELRGRHEMLISPCKPGPVQWEGRQEAVRYAAPDDGSEHSGACLGIDIYSPGYVLYCGDDGYDMFGNPVRLAFKSFSSTKIRCCGLSKARRFKSLKALADWLEEHNSDLAYVAANNGFTWSVEPGCEMFRLDEEDRLEKAGEKARAKEEKHRRRVESLLDGINRVEEEDEDADAFGEDPEQEDILAGGAEQMAEAVSRMKTLGIMPSAIRSFEARGEVLMSEAGGMLYELDGKAREAVEKAQQHGGMAYHVIHSFTNCGEMYSVLYVSKYIHDWPTERWDRRTKYVYACVYNADGGFTDLGTIGAAPANGGLVRTF